MHPCNFFKTLHSVSHYRLWDKFQRPVEWNPNILGVTFDPTLRSHKQVEGLEPKAKHQLNFMKLLTGTSWVQYKETLLATYKSLIGSQMTYAAPIWLPNTSDSSRKKVQVIQNSALRVATGVSK